ncbi:hypothetical protein [Sphaerisporangium aureirubrum]|uniref:XRE family transcriptional regulator n=1 Tax=Sphaerisporangium aureirubrum TaxID=1544736 RepID=A0ABW1NBK1_9ACTN
MMHYLCGGTRMAGMGASTQLVIDLWTGRKAGILRSALRLSVEAFAHHLGIGVRTVAKWDAEPDIVPQPSMQQVLDLTLEQAAETAKARFALLMEAGESRSFGARPQPREVMLAAAQESAQDAALRAAHCDADSIEDLHDQVVSVARAYSSRAPMAVFAEARATRDLARSFVERTRRPSELMDLYFVLGKTNALMASIAFDLGNWQAAATLARSATTYADLAQHGSLQAWTLGLQGTLAFWRDEPERSLDFITRGLLVAPEGASRHRLRYIASRAYAVQGDSVAAGKVLTAARRDRETAAGRSDELHDDIRGEFTFDDARAAACAAAAWLHLGDGERAADHAQLALDAYAEVPELRRPFSPVTGARIDLAAAHLLMRDRDAAEEELVSVFALPSAFRNASLSGRIGRVQSLLKASHWRSDAGTRDLADRIADWLVDTATRPEVADDAT